MRQIQFTIDQELARSIMDAAERQGDGTVDVLVDLWDIDTGEESYSPPTIALRRPGGIWGPPTDAYADDGAPNGYWA